MGIFERYLSLWVGVSILSGVALGSLLPGVFQAFADLEYASVNLPVAVLIWPMIYPMMVQVDFASIADVGKRPKGLALTLVVNWLIKPFTMAALGWLFFRVLFADLVDPATAGEYIAGMILLGVAPCTAMVFVWSQLTEGDANYTLVQVSVNDVIMIFAFAPIAAFLLGVSDVAVPWETLLLSVVLYVLLPLCRGVTAVDVSPVMLTALERNVDSAELRNVGTVQAGFLSYTHRSGPADFLHLRVALDHLTDFWNVLALKNARKLLRSGGVFRLCDVVYSFELEQAAEKLEAWYAMLSLTNWRVAGTGLTSRSTLEMSTRPSTGYWSRSLSAAAFASKALNTRRMECLLSMWLRRHSPLEEGAHVLVALPLGSKREWLQLPNTNQDKVDVRRH